MMDEANAVAEALGIKMPVSIDQRMAGAEKVGEHATSMLQDVDAAKPLEVGGLVGSVLELGRMLGIPMPYTSTVYACTKLLGTKTVEQSIA
jgi:2-dehydropantoate 2-reductase